MDFLVETSARHIHLTDAAIETLYGPGSKLEVKKMLSQPGQFACTNEKIKLCGPKGELMVSVLGPARKACQVELSFTDARALGLKDRLADMSEDEQFRLLASDPMLVRRPLLIGEDFMCPGFKEPEWKAVL